MLETKEHYKMYKDGKHWVTAKITTAGVALFSTMILGGLSMGHANADTVSNVNTSQVAPANSAAKQSSASVSAGASSQAVNVTVSHQNLDNAVANAKKDGVQVTQGATQNKTATGNTQNQAEQSIASDYQNQTNAVNKADAQQKQINATNAHKNDTVDHSNLDSAVKNAQSAGVNVTKQADQKITGSASDWQNKENQIKNDYQNQSNILNKAAEQQKQVNDNNSHIGSEGDHSALDSAVANAKKDGLNVVKDADQNIGSNEDASKWQDVNNQMSSDYQSQTNAVNKAASDYQAAVAKVNADNAEIDKENAAAKAQYDQEMADYQKKLAEYNQQKQQMQNAQNQMQGKLNASGVNTADLKQELNWSRSPNATLDIKALNNNLDIEKINLSDAPFDKQYVGWDSSYEYLIKNKDNSSINGDFLQATYSGNLNMSYKGQKISKVVVTFSNLNNNNGNLNLTNQDSGDPRHFTSGLMTPYIRIGNDPTDNVWYGNCQSVDENLQFYDANGNPITFDNDAYITVGSLNAYNNHLEEAQLLSSGKAIALAGSNIGVYDNNTLHSNGDQADQSTWDKGLDTDKAYYGAGVFQVNGNNVKIRLSVDRNYKSSKLGPGDTASMTKDNHPGIWALMGTTLPTTPITNSTTPPKGPDKPNYKQHETAPTATTVHYHYDKMAMQKQQPVSATYHYDDLDLTPIAPAQAEYHYDDLNVTPVENKDVDVDGQSINGKKVVMGENETFKLNSTPLPANRTEDAKSVVFTDTLDKNVKFDSWKAVDAKGNDVSKDFTLTQNGQNITLTGNKDYVNSINANKGAEFDFPTIYLNTTATASGVEVNNTFQLHYNGKVWDSNDVKFETPQTPQPVKAVDDTNGQNIDGNFVEPGQDVDFNLTFDLSSDKGVVLDKDMIAKGLGMTDTFDKRLTPNANGIKIKDASGKDVNNNLFTITDKDNVVTVMVKDPQAFENTYGGQKLNIMIPAKVNTGIVGEIPNTTTELHFGDDPKSNQVVIYIPSPHKDVAAGTIQGTSSVSIDGKNVVQGQDITFTLNTTNLPAGRKETVNSYQTVDKLDPNFDYTGFKAFLGNKDVTDEFTPTLTKGTDGQWTATFTANSNLVSEMNKDKSKEFTVPTIDIYGKAIKGGTTIKNSYVEKINNADWTSNTVSVNTENPGTPVKTVVNADGQDANNGNVERGDALIYHVSMDLTNTSKDTVLTPNTIQKGLWVNDVLPNGVTVNASGIRVNSADGKDITSQFTITDENGQVKVVAKDPAAVVKAYGGTKLDITIPTTVNDNFTGDIKNTAQQNTFGNITTSNTVVDHVQPMNPTKDVVVDLGNQNSLDGKTIALNSTFDYKLNSSSRPANYVGKTTEWGGKDMLDTKHDEFTGQWQVIADHPFVLKDGTTVKAGSDISKYFTMTYNTKTGEFDVEANKDFLDIMNLPANKKTEQGWSVFLQCKRIASGTAHNTWTEYYNGRPKNSNTVTTTTPEPKKPETPKTPAPQPQKVVEKAAPVQPAPEPAKAVSPAKETPAQPVLATPAPVKETPAPEKQAMPQTGESENNEGAIIGLAMLGAVGTMGLALKKKRYEA